jgi:hypothetical protein
MTAVRNRSAGGGTAIVMAVMMAAVISDRASAHRLDEYLQAARIGIDPSRVDIELDLTPGIALAEAIIADIDRDRDGSQSLEEQRAYAAEVSNAIRLAVDGRPLQVMPRTSSFPDLDAVRRGDGTIRLQWEARVPPLTVGAHHLSFRNAYREVVSVYLANALVPESDRVAVTGQKRESDQRALTIDYVILPGPPTSTRLSLLLGSLAGVVALAALLRRRTL